MYFCFYKTIIYYILISIFLKYNNDNIKENYNQHDIYTFIKHRSLSTHDSSGKKKKKNFFFKKKLTKENVKSKEFIEDTFVIDCSGLNNLLKNTSYEQYNMEMRYSIFKGYEKMYSELYDKKMVKKKKKKNIFKRFLSLLHRIPSKYIDILLDLLMKHYLSKPIHVMILVIISCATTGGIAAPYIPIMCSTIALGYALVPVFALLLHLKFSESH
ncbi:Plasmodium exported protein (hyp7), unknown function [Plasmodium sp. gorilla clade G3]|nr:Plasmodium exported protein (hyp7), unknown function [Plasmodium sp. gorilla clade G3]